MLSCDTSPCDLSPKRIPEKYGRPVKSAIEGPLIELMVDSKRLHMSA